MFMEPGEAIEGVDELAGASKWIGVLESCVRR